jgi:hypothetical protein
MTQGVTAAMLDREIINCSDRRPDLSGAEEWRPSRRRTLTALIRRTGLALLHWLTRLLCLRLPRLLLVGSAIHSGLRHLGAHIISRCRALVGH